MTTEMQPIRARRAGVGMAMLTAVLILSPASVVHAVECSNGGEGSNPAGNDGVDSDNTACGDGANASGVGSRNTALGLSTDASGDSSRNLAIGSLPIASGASSANTAIGRQAEASGADSANLAVGDFAEALGSGSGNTAIGRGAVASGEESTNVAIGEFARGTGSNAIAVGTNAAANWDSALGVPSGFDNAIAVGRAASAPQISAIAIGTNSKARSNLAVAIGRGAVASKPGSVAIGSDSVANSINVVAVGAEGSERRIRHVAPGQQPTDAVNLGQLHSSVASAVKAATVRAVRPAPSETAVDADNVRVEIEQLRSQLAALQALTQQQQQRIAQLERQRNVATARSGE